MEVLHDLDLTERKDLPNSRLSGGQLKRVSIGVELLTRPRLFFLDEPTSGLDPGTELEMMKLLRRLADQGRTIMLITHATKNVMMCDKVIFLARGGYLAYYCPPEEALPYFDTYRSQQERQQKDIEFDDIYMILNDEKLGNGKDWDMRYRASGAFQENVVKRLTHARSGGMAQASYPGNAARPQPVQIAPQVNKVGILRQFFILSARNVKIMTQDHFRLALMLALAPMIGMMDFIWGTNLFDIEKGDSSKIIMLLFMGGLISILVGAMGSVREIVKEVDIYKRERAINLKLLSYILSKVWVGVALSIYQAMILLAFRYILVLHSSPLGPGEYILFFITLFLGNFSGYVMGLCISAAAPNQNVALLLVIVVLVPQFLFSGALLPLNLIPGGQAISAGISTRWAFETMVNISGIGKDIASDPCWQYIQENNLQPGDLTQDQKDQMGCKCMGTAMFNSCQFPGIRVPEYYTNDAILALAAPQPVEPEQPTPYPILTRLPSLTPLATYTPLPSVTPYPTPGDQRQMQAYQTTREAQGNDYQVTREAQGSDYAGASRNQGMVYNDQMVAQGNVYEDMRTAQGDEYKAAMQTYGDASKSWQRNRDKAISSAEGKIKAVWDNFNGAFKGGVVGRWFAMAAILGVVFLMLLFFQKRKDTL